MTRHTTSPRSRTNHAAAACIVLACVLGPSAVNLCGQAWTGAVPANSFVPATDPGPRVKVRFSDDSTRAAAIGFTSGETRRGVRPTLFAVDAAMLVDAASVSDANRRGDGRASGIARSVETFTLDVVSPEWPTPASAGRVGSNGPRYSFTPQGLVLAWPAGRPANREADAFRWNGYLKNNLTLLACLHGKRILFEEKTRRGMREPLLRQWRDDIRAIPHSWGDGDPFATNYIGHPMMGAVMGYFEVFNHPAHARLEFGDRGYWKARSATLVAAAVASTQFEIGPLSEATTGLHPSKQGLSDFIMTPVLGAAWIVGEDALDHFVIAKLEAGRGPAARALLRCALNPARTLANVVALRRAWHRDTRAD